MSVSRERAIRVVEGGGGGSAPRGRHSACDHPPGEREWPVAITYTSFPPVGAVLGSMPAVGVLGLLALGTTRVDGAATGTNVAEAGTGLPSVTEVVPKGGGDADRSGQAGRRGDGRGRTGPTVRAGGRDSSRAGPSGSPDLERGVCRHGRITWRRIEGGAVSRECPHLTPTQNPSAGRCRISSHGPNVSVCTLGL